MKLAIFILSALFISCTSLAQETCSADMCIAKVKKLYPHENGNIYLMANADMSALDCTLDHGHMVLEESNKRLSEIYSMLLAAMVSEKVVVMRIANGSANCRLTYTQMHL